MGTLQPAKHNLNSILQPDKSRLHSYNITYSCNIHRCPQCPVGKLKAQVNMATPSSAAALAAAALASAGAPLAGVTPNSAAASAVGTPAAKNTPHLHSVASSLRSCLDGMLPDTLRNDATAFQQHLNHQKTRIQSEKNSWRFGLNYLFETLKQHKEWYARNQQFVQLRKDAKRLDGHVASLRTILSEAVSKLDLEAGLRVAELEGRVGAYKIMFEVTKIATKLSRPLVKLQILKPSDSSLSIYCDTFVLDIVLSASGDGTVESASLVTVEKEVSNQFPDRDEDLLLALKQLAAGESSNFTDKLIRLINRAELAVKYPTVNFEELEVDVYRKLSEASASHTCWTVKRAVDGIDIHFKDALHCLPVVEPPRKRMKVDDGPVEAAETGDDAVDPDTPNPLTHGEWTGSVSFIEWRGEVALHVVGYTPLVMVGVQARRLALAVMRKPSEDPAAAASQDDEKLFNDFVSWVPPSPTGQDGEPRKSITPQLHFARNHTVCTVSPPAGSSANAFPMRQEYSLVTKEISGGLQLHAFPIPLSHASPATISSVFQICGHSLFFHSVLLSAFASKNNAFGRRLSPDSEDVVHVPIKVDVAAPERITLKIDTLPGVDKQLLVEFTTNSDCSLALSVKTVDDAAPKVDPTAAPTAIEPEVMQQFTGACHSVPLVTYFALQRAIQQASAAALAGVGAAGAAGTTAAASGAAGADCEGIDSLDDGLAVPMKLEGEDMLMDDMNMF